MREAALGDVPGILSTMRDAFADFEGVYPEDAFEATVMNEEEARARVYVSGGGFDAKEGGGRVGELLGWPV